MRVDVHAHYYPINFVDLYQRFTGPINPATYHGPYGAMRSSMRSTDASGMINAAGVVVQLP
ncbi:MAG TPA: hypothetical protein VKB84_09350 [Candidatus Binataceae bacterium]|jgi:hypothetical protein|nr:hypothetical protein [Candidatus Binataceae bacterium]